MHAKIALVALLGSQIVGASFVSDHEKEARDEHRPKEEQHGEHTPGRHEHSRSSWSFSYDPASRPWPSNKPLPGETPFTKKHPLPHFTPLFGPASRPQPSKKPSTWKTSPIEITVTTVKTETPHPISSPWHNPAPEPSSPKHGSIKHSTTEPYGHDPPTHHPSSHKSSHSTAKPSTGKPAHPSSHTVKPIVIVPVSPSPTLKTFGTISGLHPHPTSHSPVKPIVIIPVPPYTPMKTFGTISGLHPHPSSHSPDKPLTVVPVEWASHSKVTPTSKPSSSSPRPSGSDGYIGTA